ncbi:MAG: 4-hydroxy-tetrahydrodipicolinate reductase [Rhodobacteraceae bacterium]|nr:4-hydroxy-tetrahydrodipicolinate reductase [Paracoccaceae bacterium]
MATSPLKIGIVGCAGRMGRMLISEVLATSGTALAGGSEQPGPHIGTDLGVLVGAKPLGLNVLDNPEGMFSAADVVIDFTRPEATLGHAKLAAATKTALIVGTTGMGDDVHRALSEAAQKVAVVSAPNFSLGVNVLLGLAEKAAAILGPEYDIDILEMHHRHKVDAPSGTALGLGQAVARGRQVELDQVARKSREGITGARPTGEIGFATLRGGDVVGDHTVIFAADGERIEIGHKASSRVIFARGAVRAALWTRDRRPGLYAMRDVLDL